MSDDNSDYLDLSLKQLMSLQVITVTAQRQVQPIQEVPIAITSIDSAKIQAFNVSKSSDLQTLVPGLTFTKSLASPAVFLRGVGSSYSAAGSESPTAFYIDDVYRSSTSGGIFNFNDIESIEVLKGPQGTLFGRNATGGVINVRSKSIGDKPEAKVAVDSGNYGLLATDLYAAGPLSNQLAGSLSAYHSDRDGYGKNTVTGGDAFDYSMKAYRGKLEAAVSKDTQVNFSADWSEEKDASGVALIYFPGSINSITQTALYDDDYNTTGDVDNDATTQQYGHSLIVKHDFDWARFKSISAYRHTEINVTQDGDRTPSNLTLREVGTTTKAVTQELQLLSAAESKLDWIVGAFFMDQASAYESPQTKLTTSSLTKFSDTKESTLSYAVFAQTTYPISDVTNFSVGARLTQDDKKVSDKEVSITSGNVTTETQQSVSDSWSEPTWRLSLDHHFTADSMGYVSYNRGFKTGLFNMSPFNTLPVNPEILDAVEVGYKSIFFNNRLRLNTAIYHYNYKDLQVQGNVSIDNATYNILFNAASATINGLDVDAELVVSQNFHLFAGIALIDGQYDEIRGVPFSTPNPTGGNIRTSLDLTNLTLFRTPKRSANISASYNIPSDTGNVKLIASYSYNSEYFFDAAHIAKQNALNIINSSIEWSHPSQSWKLSLWGRNLTNELRLINANSIPVGNVYSPADPRTFGVKVSYSF